MKIAERLKVFQVAQERFAARSETALSELRQAMDSAHNEDPSVLLTALQTATETYAMVIAIEECIRDLEGAQSRASAGRYHKVECPSCGTKFDIFV